MERGREWKERELSGLYASETCLVLLEGGLEGGSGGKRNGLVYTCQSCLVPLEEGLDSRVEEGGWKAGGSGRKGNCTVGGGLEGGSEGKEHGLF